MCELVCRILQTNSLPGQSQECTQSRRGDGAGFYQYTFQRSMETAYTKGELIAFKYSMGTFEKTLSSSPATSHFRSTPISSVDKSTIRRSCSVAWMLADWNPNKSLDKSPVVGGVSRNCDGRAEYIVRTWSMTAGSDMDKGLNSDQSSCVILVAEEKRRLLPSSTCSRMR